MTILSNISGKSRLQEAHNDYVDAKLQSYYEKLTKSTSAGKKIVNLSLFAVFAKQSNIPQVNFQKIDKFPSSRRKVFLSCFVG